MSEKYHGCRFRNRNGTRKKICYIKGDSCKFAANERYWRPTKSKYLNQKIYFTRQRKRLFEQRISINYCFIKQFENLKRNLTKDILELGYTDIPIIKSHFFKKYAKTFSSLS